jgi:hypothetical protein
VINKLNSGDRALPVPRSRPLAPYFYDVFPDGVLSAKDAIYVINYLNGRGESEGEAVAGELSVRSAAVSAAQRWGLEDVSPKVASAEAGKRRDSAPGARLELQERARFLQSLDLLFARLDGNSGTLWEPDDMWQHRCERDLEEYLEQLLHILLDSTP